MYHRASCWYLISSINLALTFLASLSNKMIDGTFSNILHHFSQPTLAVFALKVLYTCCIGRRQNMIHEILADKFTNEVYIFLIIQFAIWLIMISYLQLCVIVGHNHLSTSEIIYQ